MSSNNKPLTAIELTNLAARILEYFGSIEQLQAYWKTTSGKDINDLALKEFGISLYRFKQVVLGTLHIEDKTKEDVRLLKQKTWEERPAYTQEQIDAMCAKRKETCQKLYGVDNVFQSEEIKERLRSTCFDRYGAYNINSTEENKQYKSKKFKQRSEEERGLIEEKRAQTNLQRYGVANPSQRKEVITKIFETKETRYGDASYNNRTKAKATCLDKYGAEYFAQTAEFINAAKYRKYCVENAFFDSYPELAVYLYCIHNNISVQRSPARFEYTFNNKTHYCFPDFLIDDTLVEIKGAHLFERMQVPDTVENAKLNCLIQHNVEIWTIDKYKPYITWFKEQGFKKEDYLVRR